MPARRLLPLALSLALVSGCGLLPGDSDGTPRERFGQAVADVSTGIEAEVQRAVEEAKAREGERTGDIGTGSSDNPPRVDAIRTDTNTAFDYDEYRHPRAGQRPARGVLGDGAAGSVRRRVQQPPALRLQRRAAPRE